MPFHLAALMVVLSVSVASESATSSADPGPEEHPRGPGPIAPDGPLARPKSLRQTGVPREATAASAPPDNPQTPEKIALGEKLFFDGRLSVDGIVACSSCHDPARAFTDGRAVSIGRHNVVALACEA
jgi:cytochrome c peroxidase